MRGIELLKKHGVEFNCLAVVNDYNVDYPLEFYRFFKEINCRYIQFTPIVERIRKNNNSSLKLATAADEEEDVELAPFTVPAESGASSSVICLMNGSKRMWGRLIFRFSTPHSLIGWVNSLVFVPWPRHAAMPEPWSSTAMSTRAITSFFPNIGWVIYMINRSLH